MSANDSSQKIRVAVLGGGCGAMAAASYLSSTPELRSRYQVTVYQQGWQLGGKGATGRDPRPGFGNRIYEHGLHMWLGWYDSAFRMIQDVYAEWEKKPTNVFQTWTDAFAPQRFFTLQQDINKQGTTQWVTRNITMPKLPGTPGQIGAAVLMEEWLTKVIEHLHTTFAQSEFFAHRHVGPPSTPYPSELSKLLHGLQQSLPQPPDVSHPLLQPLRLLAQRLVDNVEQEAVGLERAALRELGLHAINEFQTWLNCAEVQALTLTDDLRWIWQILDFGIAVSKGILTDVLPHGAAGIAGINNLDFVAWITKHGASASTQWSAVTRAIYNLAFSFDGGITDRAHASFEAGTALMVYLKMALGYKDAPMWRMLGGMGDTVFSPIHQVLKQRGVRFEFFHRVTNLRLSSDKNQIAAIDMDVQATIKNGAEYSPLFELTYPNGKTLPCWPNEPLWDQIENAEEIRNQLSATGLTFNSAWCQVKAGTTTLQQGVDFDQIVLGISVAGLPAITPELCAANEAWRTMVTSLRTVETQAMQLWMQPALAGLGWPSGNTIMTTYKEPFDTWGEMSDVLPFENWDQTPEPPQSLHYFCGPMAGPATPPLNDPTYPETSIANARKTSLQWLDNNIGHLWPDAVIDGTQALNYNLLHDPTNGAGAARFDSQYVRANIDPSERYVASFPNTSITRLRPDASGFTNLFLAGDWTISSVNGGCVEAAVESGMMASHGICGVPAVVPNFPQQS